MHNFDDSSDSSVRLEDIGAKQHDLDSDDEFDLEGMEGGGGLLPPSSSEVKSVKKMYEPWEEPVVPEGYREGWRNPVVATQHRWERQREFANMSLEECYSAPLSNKPVDLWPDADNDDLDTLLYYKTPEGLLGKMMVHKVQTKKIRVRYTTYNTIFPSTQPDTAPPYCEDEIIVNLVDHATEGERMESFIDMALGGVAWDARTYRQAARSKQPGETILPPALGFFLHNDRREALKVPFAYPVRGCLLYRVDSQCAVSRMLKVAQGVQVKDDDVYDNKVGRFYGGLRRNIADVTHFTAGQVDDVWKLFVAASETGEEDVESGVEVFLSLERLPLLISTLLPVRHLSPDDPEDATYTTFLTSAAFVEGLWYLLSDPIPMPYPPTPSSARLNRVIRFPRVMEVLNVAMFGVKESICELIVQLLTPNRSVLSKEGLRAFFDSAFEGEDVDELVATLDEMFIDGIATLPMIRHTLFDMDVFQTWSALILPMLQARDWKRQNPVL